MSPNIREPQFLFQCYPRKNKNSLFFPINERLEEKYLYSSIKTELLLSRAPFLPIDEFYIAKDTRESKKHHNNKVVKLIEKNESWFQEKGVFMNPFLFQKYKYSTLAYNTCPYF